MIALKINLSKIDKNRIFKGEKGQYIDVIVFENDEADQYGNTCSIQMSLSKEDRDQGVKPIYLGNGKRIGVTNKVPPKQNAELISDAQYEDIDDLPF